MKNITFAEAISELTADINKYGEFDAMDPRTGALKPWSIKNAKVSKMNRIRTIYLLEHDSDGNYYSPVQVCGFIYLCCGYIEDQNRSKGEGDPGFCPHCGSEVVFLK